MKIRPCIDLHNGKVKQIVGGTLSDNNKILKENYVSDKDASFYADMYRRDNLRGGHIIKLGSGNEEQAEKALKSFPGGLQIGGGISNLNCVDYLEMGASHIIVTSYVFKKGEICWDNLEKLVSLVGKDKLVLDLSCRKKNGEYYVVTDRWQKFSNYKITENNLRNLEQYCSEFLIHAADVEGLCRGIEESLVRLLGRSVSIPATYAGGAGNLEDVELVRRIGVGKIDLTIGSALDIFGGSLPYTDILKWNKDNNGI